MNLRRLAVLTTVPVLALSGLATTSAQAADADPAPTNAAATWLAAQLKDGLLTYDSFGFAYTDTGLSIDAGWALKAVGDHADAVSAVSTAVAKAVTDKTYAADYSYVDKGVTYAGHSSSATAKALAFLLDTASTSPAVASLKSNLETYTIDSGAAAGRISDSPTKDGVADPANDYANIFGQAFAVQALNVDGSSEASAATSYLLKQQCNAGYFTEALPAVSAATPTCEATAGTASIDGTAQALLSLLPQATKPTVLAALITGAQWLAGQQSDDGSFGAGSTLGANANTTALATRALTQLGQASPTASSLLDNARKGAVWLRAHQVSAGGGCFADTASGAVAYNDDARAAGVTDGITTDTYGQWLRTTAAATSALALAPTNSDADAKVTGIFTAEYVKAGGIKPIGITGAAPGQQICGQLGDQSFVAWADKDGEATLTVRIAPVTAKSTVAIFADTASADSVVINALGKTRLKVTGKNSVAAGKRQKLTITKLAPAETVSVVIGGTTVTQGQANAKGVYVASFKVAKNAKAGKTTARVVGAFVNRKGAFTYRVK